MERALRLHRLYDQYGGLLTPRQRDVFEHYHWHDLSLGEIAENLGISRQAVYDLLRRGEAVLEQAEIALGVVAWRRRNRRRLRRLLGLIRAAEQELRDVPVAVGRGVEAGGVVESPSVASSLFRSRRSGGPSVPPGGAASLEAVERARRLLADARRMAGWMLRDLEGGGRNGLRESG